jgi:MFS transporter, DHA1 family, tetracycline resistance protein
MRGKVVSLGSRLRSIAANRAAVTDRIKGNARVMIIVEPMFDIPWGVVNAYAALYMKALGLSASQIGLLASAASASAVVWSLLGGHITDRLGRRRALLVSDLIGWTLALCIWAVSRNFWYFLAATLLNGVGSVAATAWTCLFVEDTEPEGRMAIFTALQVVGMSAGLLVPLGGLAVSWWGLIPATRGMYVVFAVSGTAMMLLRNAFTRESTVGKERIAATEAHSWLDALRDYGVAARGLLANRAAAALLAVGTLLAVRDAVAYSA